MKKVLILSQTNKDDYALKEWRKNGVETGITLKEQPKLLRAVRRLWIKFHFPLQSMWYGDWKKTFLNYDCVLLHGTWLAEDIPHWMRKQANKQKKDIKLIWWYWNKVVALDQPERVSEKDCEKWSFDKKDCETYGMRHNTQYYFKSFQLPKAKILQDIYFLGTDGGRKVQLLDLYEQFLKQHFKVDFNIYISQILPEDMDKQECFITRKMDYQENLKHIAESKAVLEVLREGQSGQTLRALECLFYRKKLITNDKSVKKYDYYHSQNIFVLGEDDLERLPIFLDEPFADVSEEMIEKYDCKQWLERFFTKCSVV